MLGHHNIARDDEVIAPPYALERGLEKAARPCGVQVGQAAIATERQEMKAAGLLRAN